MTNWMSDDRLNFRFLLCALVKRFRFSRTKIVRRRHTYTHTHEYISIIENGLFSLSRLLVVPLLLVNIFWFSDICVCTRTAVYLVRWKSRNFKNFPPKVLRVFFLWITHENLVRTGEKTFLSQTCNLQENGIHTEHHSNLAPSPKPGRKTTAIFPSIRLFH